MKRVTIVISYFNRQDQLISTLLSIKGCPDIVIVDDGSSNDIVLPDTSLNIHVLKISHSEKTWTNPEPAYNKGILYALESFNPDIIILQNPECLHVGNIVDYAREKIREDNYISFSCFSMGKDVSVQQLIDNGVKDIHRAATYDGDNAWYNHPDYRPVAFDFCSAISVNNMIKLNGYDERFSNGYAFGDNYLIHRIKMMGLKVEIPVEPFVIHQWHERVLYKDKGILYKRNMDLYNSLLQETNVRAVHIITTDFENIIN